LIKAAFNGAILVIEKLVVNYILIYPVKGCLVLMISA